MSSSGAFLRLDEVSTTVKMTGVEDHHEISTSYLSAIELLPIWIMFIDRIIDRICFSSVTLTTEPLNPHQFEASCTGGHGMRLPLTAEISAIKRCLQCRRPCIIR